MNYLAASGSGVGIGIVVVVYIVVLVAVIAGFWKMFVKAGQPGWAAIVPFYNIYVLLKISGKPGWWLILFIIPLVNIIFIIITYVALAKSFGKGGGFAVGLLLLSFIFIPILGFGSARYLGPGGIAAGYGGGYLQQGGGYGPPQGGYPQQGGGYGPPQGDPQQGGGYGPPQGG